MLDFFGMVAEYIELAFSFLVDWWESMLLLLGVLLASFNLPVTVANIAPGIIGTSAFCIGTLAVVKFMVGR